MRRSLRWWCLGAAVAGLAILGGCNKSASDPAALSKPAAAPKMVAPSPWKMTLALSPDPPVSGKDTNLHLRLADDAGKTVTGAQVKADLIMATMDMGQNEVAFADQGGGDYQAQAKFTMSGPWNAVVTAQAQGKSGQQTFPIVVHME